MAWLTCPKKSLYWQNYVVLLRETITLTRSLYPKNLDSWRVWKSSTSQETDWTSFPNSSPNSSTSAVFILVLINWCLCLKKLGTCKGKAFQMLWTNDQSCLWSGLAYKPDWTVISVRKRKNLHVATWPVNFKIRLPIKNPFALSCATDVTMKNTKLTSMPH